MLIKIPAQGEVGPEVGWLSRHLLSWLITLLEVFIKANNLGLFCKRTLESNAETYRLLTVDGFLPNLLQWEPEFKLYFC